MGKMDTEQETLSIIYGVSVRLLKRRRRVVVEVCRDTYKKQLAHFSGDQLTYLSKKPRHFFDVEDEEKLLKECKRVLDSEVNHYRGAPLTQPHRIGSFELRLFLQRGPRIQIYYVGSVLFGEWTPNKGLVLTKAAHPVISADKKHIAKVCSELPQGGGGGIFATTEEKETTI